MKLTGKVSAECSEELLLKTEMQEQDVAEYQIDPRLVNTGRKPGVESLNLKAAGDEFDTKIGLKINDMLQTTKSQIYGMGDCCSAFKFMHAAESMERMMIRNALVQGKDKMSNVLIPFATCTSPETAHVGLYDSDMKEIGICTLIASLSPLNRQRSKARIAVPRWERVISGKPVSQHPAPHKQQYSFPNGEA